MESFHELLCSVPQATRPSVIRSETAHATELESLAALHALHCHHATFNIMLASLMDQFRRAAAGSAVATLRFEEERQDAVTFEADNEEDITLDFFRRLLRLKGYRCQTCDVMRPSAEGDGCTVHTVVYVTLREETVV